MRFPSVEDIPGLKTKGININKVDKEMGELLRNVRFAILQDRKLSKVKELNSLLEDFLRQSIITHQSIRLLLSRAYKKDDYPIVSDTASLVREQIEKIFVLVTILPDPTKWIKQYIRNAWQKDYERYLLMIEEFGKIERYKEFLTIHYPKFLEDQRRRPVPKGKKGKPIILVSKFAKRCVYHNWHNPDEPKPKWFKRPKGNIRGYLNGYFYFPSPWNSAKSVKSDTNYYMFLDRWYREYKYYSAFSHILMDKLLLQHFSQYKSVAANKKLQFQGQRMAEQFITTSNIAAVTLCTLIVPRLSNDFGTLNQTKEFWHVLCGYTLFAKALWNIYPKDFLN